MMDYSKILENLQKNLEHFKFGKDGEGWFGGFNIDKDGNFNGVNLKDFAKKVSDILGYDVNFDEAEEKKETPKTESKKDTCDSSCDCKKYDTVATCAYHSEVKDNQFKLEVLIPGETADNFRVAISTKDMKVRVSRKVNVGHLPWYAACKDGAIEVDLPDGILTDSMKKNAENGLLVITGKIAAKEDFEKEI